jgi:hypothetical protein
LQGQRPARYQQYADPLKARAAVKAYARHRRMAARVEQPDWVMIPVQQAAMRVWRGGLP